MAIERHFVGLTEELKKEAESRRLRRDKLEEAGDFAAAESETKERKVVLTQVKAVGRIREFALQTFKELGVSDPDISVEQIYPGRVFYQKEEVEAKETKLTSASTITLDEEGRTLQIGDRQINLGRRGIGSSKLRLLQILSQEPGKSFSLEEVLSADAETFPDKKSVYITVSRVRILIEEDSLRPKLLVSTPDGYCLKAKFETKEILTSLGLAAQETNLPYFTVHKWCEEGNLLREGVHFLARPRKDGKIIRYLTSEGMEMLRKLAAIRDGRRRPQGIILRELQGGEEQMPEKKLDPKKVKFTKEETCKLAHRLMETPAEIGRVKISKGPSTKIWQEFVGSGGEIPECEEVVKQLTRKLIALSQNPALYIGRFQDNVPVQEVLLILQGTPRENREEVVKTILYGSPIKLRLPDPGAPLERVKLS